MGANDHVRAPAMMLPVSSSHILRKLIVDR
jgi:hypothetical protein